MSINIKIKMFCPECGEWLKKDVTRYERLKNRFPLWRCDKNCTQVFHSIDTDTPSEMRIYD